MACTPLPCRPAPLKLREPWVAVFVFHMQSSEPGNLSSGDARQAVGLKWAAGVDGAHPAGPARPPPLYAFTAASQRPRAEGLLLSPVDEGAEALEGATPAHIHKPMGPRSNSRLAPNPLSHRDCGQWGRRPISRPCWPCPWQSPNGISIIWECSWLSPRKTQLTVA